MRRFLLVPTLVLILSMGFSSLVGAKAANEVSRPMTVNGTFTTLSNTITNVRQDGDDTIYSITQQAAIYGDVTGLYTDELTLILDPDNTGNFYGKVTCTCTVADESGILMWSFSGTRTAVDRFQGQDTHFHGTGDLEELHGHGEFQGQGLHGTYSYELHTEG